MQPSSPALQQISSSSSISSDSQAMADDQQQQVQLPDLQAEVELLRNEARRKGADLRLATSALLAIHNGAKIQDLVETNLALEEQVRSLKKMVLMVHQQPHQQHGGSDKTRRVGMRRSTSEELSTNQPSELLKAVLGRDPRDDDPIHFQNNIPIATEADIQGLLSKLSTKEMQLEVLRERCAGWEQQVMDLKFELHSLKDAAKEKAEQEKRSHETLARQEQEESFCEDPPAAKSDSGGGFFSPVASPKAPNTDVVFYKNLALVRGKYWLRAEETIKALKEKLAAESESNASIRRELVLLEKTKLKLNDVASRLKFVEDQLLEKENEFAATTKELQQLRQKHQEESIQNKINRRRSYRIMQELRGELNIQLMQLEKLYNLPKPPSPRPALQRSSGSGSGRGGKQSKNFIKFQAAA